MATDWLFSQTDEGFFDDDGDGAAAGDEDDELALALAMSIGKALDDTKPSAGTGMYLTMR
jgi:hypothetical protein